MLASARIKRWALILSAYNYKVKYKPGKQHANADVLSRLPLPESINSVPHPGETILLMENLQTSPVDAKQICQWTDRDPVLSKVRRLVQKGWVVTDDGQLKPYQSRKDELSVQDSWDLTNEAVGQKCSLEAFFSSGPQDHVTFFWSNLYRGANMLDKFGRNFA